MNKHKVLVIDDEPDILKLVKISLEMVEFEVVSALSGEEALEYLENNMPALILLDVMMPDMDGYQICRHLRRDIKTKNLPIVMLTARGQKGDAEKGFKAGASEYVLKPFDPYELGKQIYAILKKHQKNRA